MTVMPAGQPGQPGDPNGQPLLTAPVPGQKPGDSPPDLLVLGGPPGGEPAPNAPSLTLALPGGREPGVGRADLKADPTQAQRSGNQAMVQAQAGDEGASSVRAVAGGVRQEQAERTAQQAAVEFLRAEEAALDEAALPPSRREQVRRYFNELRKRFEQQP